MFTHRHTQPDRGSREPEKVSVNEGGANPGCIGGLLQLLILEVVTPDRLRCVRLLHGNR